MFNALVDFYKAVSINRFNFFNNYNPFNNQMLQYKGFVLSLLSASKWLVSLCCYSNSYSLKAKPYFKNIIDNEYVLRYCTLGLSIFILVISIVILVVNKGISKTVKFVGLGRLDSYIWFVFWFY